MVGCSKRFTLSFDSANQPASILLMLALID